MVVFIFYKKKPKEPITKRLFLIVNFYKESWINFIFISEYTTKLWSWGLCLSSSKMPTGAFCPKQRTIHIIETCPCKIAKWEGGLKIRVNGAIAQMKRFVFFFIFLFAFLHQNQYSSLQFFYYFDNLNHYLFIKN